MKLPYHLLNVEEDKQIFFDIMGIHPSQKIVNSLLTSIDTVIKHNSLLDQVRTVKYPILAEEFFEEIKKYIDNRKAYYQSKVPYLGSLFFK